MLQHLFTLLVLLRFYVDIIFIQAMSWGPLCKYHNAFWSSVLLYGRRKLGMLRIKSSVFDLEWRLVLIFRNAMQHDITPDLYPSTHMHFYINCIYKNRYFWTNMPKNVLFSVFMKHNGSAANHLSFLWLMTSLILPTAIRATSSLAPLDLTQVCLTTWPDGSQPWISHPPLGPITADSDAAASRLATRHLT